MKVNFDGMRRNATNSMNALYDTINTILQENTYQHIDEDLKKELIEKFNESAMSVDFFNCVFDPDVEDDMNDLSELSICRLDELK